MGSSIAPEDAASQNHNLEPTRTNATTNSQSESSKVARIARKAGKSFSESRPAVGMFHGWGTVASGIPTLKDIESGNYQETGWSGPGQRRNSRAHQESDFDVLLERKATVTVPTIPESKVLDTARVDEEKGGAEAGIQTSTSAPPPHDPKVPYANGYQFPPKHTLKQSLAIGSKGAWNFVTTPFGFVLTIYSLNIVAWGGMLFLILCRAAPAMNPPSCPDYNDKNCPNQVWLEICSQILNALFCVTGLGLIPWRFRDLWFLLQWRYRGDQSALRRLAGIHRNWFRLRGSQEISPLWDQREVETDDALPSSVDPSTVAIPIKLSPDAPLTGERASASVYWKMDFVIWGNVWNTFFQIALCGVMWGLTKWTRPSWVTGFLISCACIVAGAAGFVVFQEGKRVKKVEGVPVSKEDLEILKQMNERQKERERANAAT